MPLVPQQDIVVIAAPYQLAKGQSIPAAAAEMLRARLEAYPPCRIVSLVGVGSLHAYTLTAVIENV